MDDAGDQRKRLTELMVAYQAGDAMAFEKLYGEVAGPVLGYLRSLTRDAARAEDLLQETFFHVHRARHTFHPERSAKAWIFAIAHNVVFAVLGPRHDAALLGLSVLTIIAAFIFRATPQRAALACLLGGAGAGLMAEGIYHLHCGITDLRHVFLWHGGAVVALTLIALAAGLAWERRESARMAARLSR